MKTSTSALEQSSLVVMGRFLPKMILGQSELAGE
jgi:hypothetical protein